MHSFIKQRADIDGLRGIAILAVLGFHTFPNLLPGGFTGVDVFFVISGFLISSIIFTGLDAGKFSFRIFYIRRIKRLFPSLNLVLATSFLIGWFLLLDDEFRTLGKQIFAGAVFSSNLYFLHEKLNYFQSNNLNAAMLQPLLHLWSLGVEEQFYLFWPGLLWILWKKRLNTLFLTILITLASFLLNLYWSWTNPVTAFFSPLTRMWEPLLGAILSYVTLYKPGALALPEFRYLAGLNKTRSGNMLAIFGTVLIILSLFLITEKSIFPGWLALLPTTGSFLLILAGPTAWINKKILSGKLLVWFGLISYPLYLWHWPLLSFAYINQLALPSAGLRILCVATSILLAWLSYQFVEKPIRFGTQVSFKPIMLCGFMITIGLVGFYTYKINGFPLRFPPVFASERIDKEWRGERCWIDGHNSSADLKKSKWACVSKGKGKMIFLWGDSFAGALYPGLKHLQVTDGIGLAQFTASACPPIINYSNPDNPVCKRINEDNINFIKKLKPDIVMLVSSWGYHRTDKQIRETLQKLQQIGVPAIVILGSPPRYNYSLRTILYRHFFTKNQPDKIPVFIKNHLDSDYIKQEKAIADIAQTMEIKFISAYKAMCNKDGCLSQVNDGANRVTTTFDDGHLSPQGAIWLVQAIKEELLK